MLDEPNSNLDAPGELALANALSRAKKRNITVVAITQRPALLQSVDKIMVIKEGTAQAIGKRDDIIPLLAANGAGKGAPMAHFRGFRNEAGPRQGHKPGRARHLDAAIVVRRRSARNENP